MRGLTYLQAQDRHSATVGSLSASISSRAHREDEQSCDRYLVLSSKALADRIDEQLALMSDTLQEARFDEHTRIRDLISQIRARRDQGITGSGHALAMSAACAGMSPLARLSHEQGGLEGIRRIRALDDSLHSDSELASSPAHWGLSSKNSPQQVGVNCAPLPTNPILQRRVSLPSPQWHAQQHRDKRLEQRSYSRTASGSLGH